MAGSKYGRLDDEVYRQGLNHEVIPEFQGEKKAA
ncbi:MAG: hypothetical protein ACI9LD_001400 [Polaromonas sp.]|jgi:hypothetical protein